MTLITDAKELSVSLGGRRYGKTTAVIHALQEELRAALSRAEEAEGKLCRAREALRLVVYAHELGGSVKQRILSGPVTRESQWLNAKTDAIEAAESVLSSSSPCRHAAIAERV